MITSTVYSTITVTVTACPSAMSGCTVGAITTAVTAIGTTCYPASAYTPTGCSTLTHVISSCPPEGDSGCTVGALALTTITIQAPVYYDPRASSITTVYETMTFTLQGQRIVRTITLYETLVAFGGSKPGDNLVPTATSAPVSYSNGTKTGGGPVTPTPFVAEGGAFISNPSLESATVAVIGLIFGLLVFL
jgi:hypothetical protein